MTDEQARLILPFALLSAILAISTASILIRLSQAEGAPSIVIAALRMTFATMLLSPVVLTRHLQELKKITLREAVLGGLAGVLLAVHFATWILSLEFTSVASSAVLVSTGPVWVALLAPLFLDERISRTALLGVVLSLTGGTLIGWSDACAWNHGLTCPGLENIRQDRALWGNFLALVGAWAVSGYLIIGRNVRSGMPLLPYIFMVYGMAALALLICMAATRHSPLGYSPKTYGLIFLLAALPQLIGHTTLNWALKYLPAAMVSLTTLGEPVGSAVLAFFFLHETPLPAVVIGGVLILSGIYLASRQSK